MLGEVIPAFLLTIVKPNSIVAITEYPFQGIFTTSVSIG